MAEIMIQFIECGIIWVTATNNRFSGESMVYIDRDGQKLISLGNRLKGFPKQINDVEEMELGSRERVFGEVEEGAGCLGLKFYCLDKFGHLAVFVTLEELRADYKEPELGCKVSFEMGLEPAQIDQFVEEVIELGKTKQGTATLECIPL